MSPRLHGLLVLPLAGTALAAELCLPHPLLPPVGEGVRLILTSGQELEGISHGLRDGAIWIEIEGGEAGVAPEEIARAEPSASASAEFRRRLDAIGAKDARGFWALSRWARERGLGAAAALAAERTIAADPEHAGARVFLGYEKIAGRWLAGDEVFLAKGLVRDDGEWVTPESRRERELAREKQRKELMEAARERRLAAALAAFERAALAYAQRSEELAPGLLLGAPRRGALRTPRGEYLRSLRGLSLGSTLYRDDYAHRR